MSPSLVGPIRSDHAPGQVPRVKEESSRYPRGLGWRRHPERAQVN